MGNASLDGWVCIVQHGLQGYDRIFPGLLIHRPPSPEVPGKCGEVGTGDAKPDGLTWLKGYGGRAEVYCVFVDLVGLDGRRGFQGVTDVMLCRMPSQKL